MISAVGFSLFFVARQFARKEENKSKKQKE